MGVMDFLKNLFSSKSEDQTWNSSSESGTQESAPEEPKIEEVSGESLESQADDSNFSE